MMLRAVILVSLCGLVVTEAYAARLKAGISKLSDSSLDSELVKLTNMLKQREVNDATSIAKSHTKRQDKPQDKKDKDSKNDDEDLDEVDDERRPHRALDKTLDVLTAMVDIQRLLIKFRENKAILDGDDPTKPFDVPGAIRKIIEQFRDLKKEKIEDQLEQEEEEEEEVAP